MQVITITQQFTVSVVFLDAQNNPAPVDRVEWGSSDENVILVVQDTLDNTKATVYAKGVGTGQVNVRADARVGEGEKLIVGTLDVEVLGGEAVTVVISTGEVTEQEGPHVEPVTGTAPTGQARKAPR